MRTETTIRSRTALLEDAKAIIDREYATDLELDDVARRIASSRRNVQRSFDLPGVTYRGYLAQVRMQRAAELLATTKLSVRQIANRVGYRQPAQFAKAYRRAFGLAPSEFRSRLSGRDAERATTCASR